MGFPFEIHIYGNTARFTGGLFGAYGGWALKKVVVPTAYTSPVPNTARLETPKASFGVECLVFKFGSSMLDDHTIHNMANSDTIHQKSNIFGKSLDGPFSWMARILKSGGASSAYDVKSPMTLFKWTAYDLAKYCDRLALAIQRSQQK